MDHITSYGTISESKEEEEKELCDEELGNFEKIDLLDDDMVHPVLDVSSQKLKLCAAGSGSESDTKKSKVERALR